MTRLRIWLQGLVQDRQGASVAEYAVLAALIIGAVIVVIAAVGMQLEHALERFMDLFEQLRS